MPVAAAAEEETDPASEQRPPGTGQLKWVKVGKAKNAGYWPCEVCEDDGVKLKPKPGQLLVHFIQQDDYAHVTEAQTLPFDASNCTLRPGGCC